MQSAKAPKAKPISGKCCIRPPSSCELAWRGRAVSNRIKAFSSVAMGHVMDSERAANTIKHLRCVACTQRGMGFGLVTILSIEIGYNTPFLSAFPKHERSLGKGDQVRGTSSILLRLMFVAASGTSIAGENIVTKDILTSFGD